MSLSGGALFPPLLPPPPMLLYLYCKRDVRKEEEVTARIRNVTGERFNHLVGVRFHDKTPKGLHRWIYRCDCGEEVVRVKKTVSVGKIISCGCKDKSGGAKRT